MNTFLVSLVIIMSLFGFAGGGGSSSGGGGGGGGSSSGGSSSFSSDSSSGESDPIGAAIGISVVVIVIIFAAIAGKNQGKYHPRRKYTESEQKLLDDAKNIFIKYQNDWTNGDTSAMKEYMTPSYHQRATLMMQTLKNLHRQNRVSQLKVNGADLMNSKLEDTDNQNLTIKYHFDGLDEVVDRKFDNILYSQKVFGVTETWNFEYGNKKLLLDGISQPTESAPHLVKELNRFALDHKMYYSPDWGRYALPIKGLIFDNASMYKSDVNNHIIGQWKDVLVQMYTYAQTPGTPSSYYIVGQLTVPKRYVGIIVKRRDFKKKAPRNYQKYDTEWQDFNKKYEVWATDPDKVTSFELLNPKFMADLYDNDRSYNIEVVGNTIYLFAPISKVAEKDYKTLLNILLAAHKELKM